MAVYKRRYNPYTGTLTPQRWRFFVLTRYALAELFHSRVFVLLFILMLVPVVLFASYVFVANNNTVQLLLRLRTTGAFNVDQDFFFVVIMVQTQLAFLLNCWAGPILVSGDLTNGALPLFLSRPFSRPEYVLGKFAVLGLLLSLITWVPGLLLFGLQAGLAGNGWIWSHLWMVIPIVFCSWIWILMLAFLSLAISAWVKLRIVATGVIFMAFFGPAGIGAAFDAIMNTHWGNLLNYSELFRLVMARGFRVALESGFHTFLPEIPLPAAWMMMVLLCVLCLFVLNARLRAREVVRG